MQEALDATLPSEFPVMTALDHIVFNTQDRMDEAVALFEHMGFCVSPRGFHTLGSINHTIVFGTDYLELLGYPPGQPPARRPELVTQPIGLMATVWQTADADAAHAALSQRGFKPRAVQSFSRPVDLGGYLARDQTRDAAFRVTRLEPDAVPGTWVYYCQHLTPELVWRPEWQAHANGALGMCAIDIAVPDMAAALPRYRACMLDGILHGTSETVGASASQATLPLRDGMIRLHRQAAPARMSGLTFRVASLDAAHNILTRANIAHSVTPSPDFVRAAPSSSPPSSLSSCANSILIDPALTFGATLQLTALAR